MMGRLLVLVAVALFGLAAPAAASTIVYGCGSNLCQVHPDGSGRTQLTGNGGYSSPSLSRDGRQLAFIWRHAAYLESPGAKQALALGVNSAMAVSIRPDGGRVAAIQYQAEVDGGLSPYLTLVDPDGGNFEIASRGPFTTGWLGTTLLRDGYSDTSHQCRTGFIGDCSAYSICRFNVETGSCIANVADDPVRDLSDPSGSPDGKLVAATASPYPDDGSAHPDHAVGAIALFDASTGKLVRDLTHGSDDSHPSFSPDGHQVAFDRGDGVYVIGAGSAAGNARRVAAGTEPTWAAGDIRAATKPDTRITAAAVSIRRHRVAFRVKASGGAPPYRFQCRMSGQSRRLGRWRRCTRHPVYRNLRSGRHTFRVRAIDSNGAADATPSRRKFRIR